MVKAPVLDKNSILVVDDDREFTGAVCAALTATLPNMNLIKAYDGNAAVYIFENQHPAIIILDMMLPKRSGFLVLEKIRRTYQGNPRPYIIMITANEGARHKSYAEMLGVNRYLRKPFEMQTLIDSVLQAIAEF